MDKVSCHVATSSYHCGHSAKPLCGPPCRRHFAEGGRKVRALPSKNSPMVGDKALTPVRHGEDHTEKINTRFKEGKIFTLERSDDRRAGRMGQLESRSIRQEKEEERRHGGAQTACLE